MWRRKDQADTAYIAPRSVEILTVAKWEDVSEIA